MYVDVHVFFFMCVYICMLMYMYVMFLKTTSTLRNFEFYVNIYINI